MNHINRKKLVWEIIGIFGIFSIIYLVIKKDNIYIQTHDFLDSNISWIKMLKDNHLFWIGNGSVPFLGGIDRNYLYSELKAYTWLYMLFPIFTAMIIGWYLKIIISIAGFIYLGKTLKDEYCGDREDMIIWCGFLYGVAPTYPPVAFAFASLPFLLGILIRCYHKFRWKYILVLLLYPMLSDFSLFGIFICGYLVLYFVIDWIVKKRARWSVLGCLCVLAVGYIIVEWRLFAVMLFSGEQSLRSTMSYEYVNGLTALKDAVTVFIRGYYHAGSLHTYVVLPVCMINIFVTNLSYIKNRQYSKLYKDSINWLLLWIIFNCMIYALNEMKWFKGLVSNLIPALRGFSFTRTIWFNPFLWYFMFFLVLCRIKWDKVVYTVAVLAGIVVCIGPETYNQIFFNCLLTVCNVVGEEKIEALVGRDLELLTYKEFYSTELFEEIKKDIDYEGEWSVAFGMHPAILEYNGISTLDGYLSYYPQSYKEQFRKLIEPELEIDPDNREYFDSWGGRAYIYSNEISYNPAKIMSQDEADMNIDPEVFRDMKGKYIFSRVRICNADALGIELLNQYQREGSPYTIYLYALKN